MALKLTKDQISALARTIRAEITEPITEHNARIRASEEYVNFEEENEDCIALTRIAEKCDILQYASGLISIIKRKYFENKLMCTNISLEKIEDSITLKTIEYDNIQDIINSVKSKFEIK